MLQKEIYKNIFQKSINVVKEDNSLFLLKQYLRTINDNNKDSLKLSENLLKNISSNKLDKDINLDLLLDIEFLAKENLKLVDSIRTNNLI